ncbi:prolyl oligopeptidase family serine peptidase [Pedobacter sp. NJ-S-72]
MDFSWESDDQIPIAETERVYRKLKKSNSHVLFTRLKNKGHGIQYLYEDHEIYKWLLRQHK